MKAALRLARAAAVRDEIPVGCIIVHEGETLAEACNETIQRQDPTAHAELLAIQRACGNGGAGRLREATMYVTLEPCAQCAGAIVLAKVARVIYGAHDARWGMAGSVYDILREPRLNHRPDVMGGFMEAECAELLKRFFVPRRET